MRTSGPALRFSAKELAEELAPKVARILLDQTYRPPVKAREVRAVVKPERPSLENAIHEVIEATDRLDADQFTIGEAAAAKRLFQAAQRLRAAARRL
ncbi:hypothetical protein [Rhizobium sp. S163]|uniref:hypothetical protein n=1 Tax=Rhizobium sp. S163 TaxID=3055039 RepID=UPI0025A9C8DF|nr:hypothetical protein [Rhizobium sp. S163]MDM9647722.1 hypothetical protein [Rhizobium sp. S163]